MKTLVYCALGAGSRTPVGRNECAVFHYGVPHNRILGLVYKTQEFYLVFNWTPVLCLTHSCIKLAPESPWGDAALPELLLCLDNLCWLLFYCLSFFFHSMCSTNCWETSNTFGTCARYFSWTSNQVGCESPVRVSFITENVEFSENLPLMENSGKRQGIFTSVTFQLGKCVLIVATAKLVVCQK